MKTLYQELHARFVAIKNCERMGNDEWKDKHGEAIRRLVYNFMPSGSGWDRGTKYDLDLWTNTKMVFYGAYHHMNGDGYYDGWTDHVITVRPSFSGIELTISGSNRNDVKEYLHGIFMDALCRSDFDIEAAMAAA